LVIAALPLSVQVRPALSEKLVVPTACWSNRGWATTVPHRPLRISAAWTRPTAGTNRKFVASAIRTAPVELKMLVTPLPVTGSPSCVHGAVQVAAV
jgi:hypothetical protein